MGYSRSEDLGRKFEDILQVLLQKRKELWETQKRIEAQLATLTELVTRLVTLIIPSNSNTSQPSNFGDVENFNHKEVHEYLEEVEEENVDQEMADKDKESKGMEIIQSASSEATPRESPSKLHFEWVNLFDMNLLGPQHYALLETDDQLRVLCGVLDKKEMNSLGMDESSTKSTLSNGRMGGINPVPKFLGYLTNAKDKGLWNANNPSRSPR
ncbi:hypothetical protein PIB30_061044 [Stylosanthes scabra]|uniref:Uncharacterized protein n=1 Tax=Stylosanthes scabra TaxID=79078 RepID=A0ABU6SLS9_9FABA|nr:hypothetical protein [Stylosanthes scabra]